MLLDILTVRILIACAASLLKAGWALTDAGNAILDELERRLGLPPLPALRPGPSWRVPNFP